MKGKIGLLTAAFLAVLFSLPLPFASAADGADRVPRGASRRVEYGAAPDLAGAAPVAHAADGGGRGGLFARGALILSRPFSLREVNPTAHRLLVWLVSAAILITAGLSGFMVVLRRKNRALVRTQQDLYAAKNSLERALQSAPLAYMLLIGDRVVEANPYLLDNLDIVSSPGDGLYTLSPEMAEVFGGILWRNNGAHGTVLRLRMKNGEVHSFHVNLAPVSARGERGIVFWGTDIEERGRDRESIARMQAELQKLVDTVPIPIFICLPDDYEIMYANGAFLEMFGFAAMEDALGVSLKAFHPDLQPDGRNTEEMVAGYVRRAMGSDAPETMRMVFAMPDGRELHTQVTSSFVIYKYTGCLVVVIWDMTAEKEREAMLLRAAEKEHEANQMKSLFLMNMSHEIRTPMNAIIGFSQLALFTEKSPASVEIFEKINVSAKSLLSIINDILDFSKIEAEKIEIQIEDFDLEEIVSNACMIASEKIEDKRVEMLVDIAPDVPCRVLGDKTRMWQILKNLLDNSAKYTESGRVVLRIDTQAGEADENAVLLRFVVEDTGVGMSEEQLGRIFTPFEQFQSDMKSNLAGTGLGMPITKRFVSLMGGSIAVESRLGEGTTVTVLLTLRRGEGALSTEGRVKSGGLDSERVLIAAGDKRARRIMGNLMGFAGVPALCVSSAAEVFEAMRERPFEIVVLDCRLGEDDGIEVAKKLREAAPGGAKLLMVSAYAKRHRAQEIEEAGFGALIEKPFTPSAFIEKLKSLMHATQGSNRAEDYLRFPGARVLLCEDNTFNREVASGMLGIFGIVPAVAGDGREAIEMLERGAFHMVFMDIMMPVMDGHEATVAIRGSGKPYAAVPIVAMTANVMPDEVDRCREEGMNGHIGKPMEMQQIYESLLRHLPPSVVDNAIRGAAAAGTEREMPVIEGVDVAAGAARFAGKVDRYTDALARFAAALGDDLLPWPEAVAPRGREYTRRVVHTLRGASGNLGIGALSEEAAAFERELEKEEEREESYGRLAERCRAVREQIGAWARGTRSGAARPAGSADELRSLIARMGAAFESSRLELCGALIKRAAETGWDVDPALMRAVAKAIEEYDFEGAERLLGDREERHDEGGADEHDIAR